jgi:excisionase family DNA binding protein
VAAAMVVIGGEEYLTVDEAAERLAVKPATLYAYVSRGVLRSYRQGMQRQRLYRRVDVDGLRRLQPSTGAPVIPDIPFAESWIRE